jgi:hypothetical protein
MISPHFVVPDVLAAAEYCRDVLGFRILSCFLDPPVFATVARDSVEIQFGRADGKTPPSSNWTPRLGGLDAYIWVNDLDSLHPEGKARGAKIIEAPGWTVGNWPMKFQWPACAKIGVPRMPYGANTQ